MMGSFLAVLTGLLQGLVTGTTLAAFYRMLGLVTRLQQALGTQRGSTAAPFLLMAGMLLASGYSLFGLILPLGAGMAAAMGLMQGIFVGMVVSALAEVLEVFTNLLGWGGTRINILIWTISLALGKLAGALMYFFYQPVQ
nr:stage V sporulation protein AB [bacterium]